MAVLNYKNTNGIPDGAIFIGRPSRWGNSFRIKRGVTREQALAAYRVDLWGRIRKGEVTVEELAALHGHDLVCYCTPKPCHGHILERAAAWAKGKTAS